MGACGLESDVWVTADGIAVLHHDERVRAGLRRRRLASVPRAALPAHVPTLEDLYGACGTGFELSLDVKEPAAAVAAVNVARAAGADVPGRLWLCHPDSEMLATWRAASADVKLVNSTKLQRMPRGPEQRAAQLAEAGVDAVNLHYREWTGGLTTLFHRFGRLAFAWDAQHERVVRELMAMGVDAVYSDHVDRLVAVMGREC